MVNHTKSGILKNKPDDAHRRLQQGFEVLRPAFSCNDKGDIPPAPRVCHVFIHHDGALGDLLLSLPAIRIIRQCAHVVHIAGRADAVRFLRDTGVVDEVMPSDHPLFLSLYGSDPDDRSCTFLSSYDRVFLFTRNGESPLAESFRSISGDVHTILTIPPDDHPVHCAVYRVQQIDLIDAYTRLEGGVYAPKTLMRRHHNRHKRQRLKQMVDHTKSGILKNKPDDAHRRLQQGLEALRPAFSCNCVVDPSPAGSADVNLPFLTIPERAREEAREFLAGCGFDGIKPLVAIHPGSGGKRKCWSVARFIACLEHLERNAGVFPVIVTGPADDGAAKAFEDFCGRTGLQAAHARNVDLMTIAALLAECRLYIGNDSGISHLAAAVNGNVVAVFGPTDPRVWRPAGKGVRVVASGEPCAPCGDERSRACSGRTCLESVSVARVLEEAGRFL
jgi:ADP-heptose:LPS heptosyltransferase